MRHRSSHIDEWASLLDERVAEDALADVDRDVDQPDRGRR